MLLLVFLPFLVVVSASGPIVQTSFGGVQSKVIVTPRGNRGHVYQGVPFAEPPIGNLRFKPPEPKKPWDGILKAQAYGAACWQNMTSAYDYHPEIMGEDCLFLNIFAPEDAEKNSGKYPVAAYMPGGGWMYDSPNMFPIEPTLDHFVKHGLIFVTIAYRLGGLGFWTTGMPEASGNNALKDVIVALQWIQTEISSFGGNPNKVTIMGHSSAGMGVSMLSLSPLAKGLFHQVLPMSGSGLGAGAASNDLGMYEQTAISLGCSTKKQWEAGTFDGVLECMQTVDINKFGNSFSEVSNRGIVSDFPMTSPRIDGPGGVLPEPIDVLAQKRPPLTMLTGTTANELGLYLRSMPTPTKTQIRAECSAMASRYKSPARSIADACIYHYDSEVRSGSQRFSFYNQPLKLISADVTFFSSAFADASSMRSAGGKVYLYSMDYVELSQKEFQPMHAVDVHYLFGLHPSSFQMTPEDEVFADYYGKLLSNFIISGNPSSQWEPLRSPVGFNYFSINTVSSNNEFYHFDAVQFWNRIVPYLKKFGGSTSGNENLVKLKKFSTFKSLASWTTGSTTDFNSLAKIYQKLPTYLSPQSEGEKVPFWQAVSNFINGRTTTDVASDEKLTTKLDGSSKVQYVVLAVVALAFGLAFTIVLSIAAGKHRKKASVAVSEDSPLLS